MFREQFNGFAVGVLVGLRQVFHGFHQQTLAFHVSRIVAAFAFTAPGIGLNWNSENLGHKGSRTLLQRNVGSGTWSRNRPCPPATECEYTLARIPIPQRIDTRKYLCTLFGARPMVNLIPAGARFWFCRWSSA